MQLTTACYCLVCAVTAFLFPRASSAIRSSKIFISVAKDNFPRVGLKLPEQFIPLGFKCLNNRGRFLPGFVKSSIAMLRFLAVSARIPFPLVRSSYRKQLSELYQELTKDLSPTGKRNKSESLVTG